MLEDLKVKISHIWSRVLCEGLCSLKIHVEVFYLFFSSFHFFFLFNYFLFYFSILCWFCHTLTWILHGYTCVPHPEPPPTSLPIPYLWVIPVHQPWSPCPCIELGLAVHFTYDNLHVSMPFSYIILPLPSPTESKSLFNTSVSHLLIRIQCYCYNRSKFHIYVLVYCIGVFLSGLLHSV